MKPGERGTAPVDATERASSGAPSQRILEFECIFESSRLTSELTMFSLFTYRRDPQRRSQYVIGLRAVFVGWLLLAAMMAPAAAFAQDGTPVKLLELIGPRAVFDGEIINYRARVDDASTRPVGFLWDFGDGIASEGTLVAHRYRTPGVYTVTVVAYNTAGRDTLQARVRVTERPEEEPAPATSSARPAAPTPSPRQSPSQASPAAEAEPPRTISRNEVRERLFGHEPIQPATDGYTWILVSDLWSERIQRTLLQYRLQGLRVEIMEETRGSGSRVYRVIAGHFPTIGQALMARAMLNLGDQTATLHSFAPDGLQLAVSGLPSAIEQLSDKDRRWIDALTPITPPLIADAPNARGAAPENTPENAGTASGLGSTEQRSASTNAAGTEATDPTALAEAAPSASSPVATPSPVVTPPPAASSGGTPTWLWLAAGMLASMTLSIVAFLWYGLSGTKPVPAAGSDPPREPAAKKAQPPIVPIWTDRRLLPA